jgi:hypothetical protein
MDGKSRPQLPPPFLGEGAGMAHVFAAAIRSTGAKREAQFERLAVALDVLDAQGIILVGTSFGVLVPSEQVNPSSTDAGLKGRAPRERNPLEQTSSLISSLANTRNGRCHSALLSHAPNPARARRLASADQRTRAA